MQEPAAVTDLDWDPARARDLGEKTVALWAEFLEALPDLPVARRHRQQEVRDAVVLDIPSQPLPVVDLIDHLRTVALEHSMYPGHPGFVAYISGAGTVPGAVADLLAAAIDQNVGGWMLSPAATEIELALGRHFAGLFDLPATAGGIFTSGGAMANFVALKVARDRRAGWDVSAEGLHGGAHLVLYASDQAHVTIDRAADMLGIGRGNVRHIPTDSSHRMDLDALAEAIAADRAAGSHPLCVIGTAGTTTTGSLDPLADIAELCRANELWFHVDAAYGGAGMMVDSLTPLYRGIEAADSITFDPHKWLYTPQSGGFVLVRDLQHLADSFSAHAQASYVHQDKERTGRGIDIGDLGPQFSRGFQGLKVWVSLLAHGTDAYARRIEHDVELARYLEALVQQAPDFEVLAPTVLSIACFRFVPEDLEGIDDREAYLNILNERLMTELQLDGRMFPSNCVVDGRFGLRVCIVNFRTEATHMRLLLEVSREIGIRLHKELTGA